MSSVSQSPQLPEGDQTRLWYASYQTISGILLRIGPTTLFSPTEDVNIYVVDPASVLVRGEVQFGPVKTYILSEIAQKLSKVGGAL
jgi:hypothetical protein